MKTAEPYLCIGGVELGNALRTLTYLRRGLGGTKWEVHVANLDAGGCVTESHVENDVYVDTYSDLYGGSVVTTTTCDPFWPGNLSCYCAAFDHGPYVSPDADDAPWFTLDDSDSADFLGFIPHNVEERAMFARAVSQLARGSLVGPQSASGRIVVVEGLAYAASPEGMKFGLDWLRATLADELCDTDRDLQLLPACGDPPNWRVLRDVALVDGPVFDVVADGVPSCVVASVSFQLVSEEPYALSEAVVLADQSLDTGSAADVLASQGDVPGDSALSLTYTARTASTLTVSGYATSSGVCPSLSPSPAWSFSAVVPSGYVLTVDAVSRLVTLRNPATDDVEAGLDALTYVAPFRWPTLVRCSETCVHLSTTGHGHLTLTQTSRRV